MKQKCIKRLLCMLLCAAMMLSMLPMPVYAYVGAMEYNPGNVTAGEETVGGKKIFYLKNDFIGFYIGPDGNLHTYPSQKSINEINFADYTEKNVFIMQFSNDQEIWQTAEGIFYGIQKDIKIDDSDPNNPRLIQTMEIGAGSLGHAVVEICYKVVQLDSGAHDIYHQRTEIIDEGVGIYDDTTWGIEGRATLIESSGFYSGDDRRLLWTTIHRNFGAVGHNIKPNIRINRHITESYTSDGVPNKLFYSSPLFPEKSYISAENVDEVYTDSFSYANQFVALDGYIEFTGRAWNEEKQDYEGILLGGVEGHLADKFNDLNDYGIYLKYDGKDLFAVHDIVEKDYYNSRALWGFRDLYSNTEGKNPPPDPVTISGNATYLGIVKDGSKLITKPGNSMDGLSRDYGKNLLAVFQGEFEEKENGDYICKGNSLRLAPAITASWSITDKSTGIVITKNGEIKAT